MIDPDRLGEMRADIAADALIGAWLDGRADINAPITPDDLGVLHALIARQLIRWQARGARAGEDREVGLRQLLGRIIQAARTGAQAELDGLLNRASLIMIAGRPAAFPDLDDDKQGEAV